MLRPLLAGSAAVFQEMSDKVGEEVVISGRYFPSTGLIIASGLYEDEADVFPVEPDDRP